MLPQTLNHNLYVEREQSKNVILKNVLIQLTMFNKDRHMANFETLKKTSLGRVAQSGDHSLTTPAIQFHSQTKLPLHSWQ